MRYVILFRAAGFFLMFFCNQGVSQINNVEELISMDIQATEYSIQLRWPRITQIYHNRIEIFRSRNNQPFELLAEVPNKTSQYEDLSAIFGHYRYRLKFIGEQTIESRVVATEIYFGSYSRLYPVEAVQPGFVFRLVLGNATKNEEISFGIYNQEGDAVEPMETRALDNQRILIDTKDLEPGVYLAVVKLNSLSEPRLYRFEIGGLMKR